MFRCLSRRRRRPEDAPGAADRGALPEGPCGAGDRGAPPEGPCGAGDRGALPEGPPGAADRGALPEDPSGAADRGALPEGPPRAGNRGALPEGPHGAGNHGALLEGPPGAGDRGALPEGPSGAGDRGALPEGPPGAGDRGALPEGPPGAGDRGALPEGPPGAGDRGALPEEFSTQSWHRQPGQGRAWLWGQDGTRHSPGAGHTGRNAGIPGEAGDGLRCAQVNGKEPGGHQNGGARREQTEVGNSPRGIQALGKEFGDKAGVPRQARNGNVPREGTDRPRRRAPLPPRAGNREDEEGKASGNSQSRDTGTATRNGNVPREGADGPVCIPTVWVAKREDEEGEASSNSRSNSQSRDIGTATRNGNVPREGTDRPRSRAPLPPPLPPRAGCREDEEGEPSSNSQSRWRDMDKDKDSATWNGNVPREGTDRPRRRAPLPPPLPPRAGRREDEEGEPSSNSQRQERDKDKDTDTATWNGNVPREGTDQPVCIPTVWVCSGEDGEGEARGDSQSRDTGTATRNGNVPREGTDGPLRLPSVWVVKRENEEGKPSSNSQSWGRDTDKDKDTDTATRNGNVPREGTDGPVCLPSVWVVKRENEEGKPSSNSQSRGRDTDKDKDKNTALRNGNVPREVMDRQVRLPTVRVVSGKDEEGEARGYSRSQDKDSATRNGNVPRDGMDRPRCRVPPPLPPWAGSREDEEGKPCSNSRSRGRDTAAAATTAPRRDRRTEPPSGAECREWLWQRLLQLGEDMQSWQGRPTAELAAGLARRIAGTRPLCSARQRERGSGASLDRGIPSGNYRNLLGMLRASGSTENVEEDSGSSSSSGSSSEQEQGSGAIPDGDIPSGNYGSLRMLRASRSTENMEEDSGSSSSSSSSSGSGSDQEQGSGASPNRGIPSGNYRNLLGMLRARGSTENVEEDSGSSSGSSSEQEQGYGAIPDGDIPSGNYGSIRMLRASHSTENMEEDSGSSSSSSSGSGSGSDREQGSGASPDGDIPSRIYGSLLRMLRASQSTENVEEDSGSEQGSEASPDGDIPSGNYGSFVGMLRASGNAESAEEDSGLEQEQEQEQPPSRLELRFPEVWARSRMDCGRVAQEEDLDGDPVPFQRQCRLRPHEERQMAELLQEYLEQGIVVEGTSQSNNPLILHPKPHGRGVYLSLDCAALNDATPAVPRESLDRDGLLTSINPRSRFFSVLDLCSACFAIPLAPSCRHRFAFTFRGRQFLFTRLPPTFRGASSILHRRVAAMLARLDPGVARGVFHYYDDILVTGKCRRQLRFRTRRVLRLIQSTGFKVNRHKAQLVQPKVNYLGMTLSAAGRRVPHEKLLQICQECDPAGPWGPARLRSVLGKFNHLREFIADYLELALPLQSLAVPEKWEGRRGREWQQEWDREGRERLQRLKEALRTAPTLLLPFKTRPFVIQLSVHERSVGAVLLQEKAGALLPVRHGSFRLSGQSRTLQDASCLAAVRAVQAFRKLTGPAPIFIQGPAGRYLLRGEQGLDGYTGNTELPERW